MMSNGLLSWVGLGALLWVAVWGADWIEAIFDAWERTAMDDGYRTDERAGTPAGLIAGLHIFEEAEPGWLLSQETLGAEDDALYFFMNGEDIPEASDAGRRLIALGFHLDEGDWVYLVA